MMFLGRDPEEFKVYFNIIRKSNNFCEIHMIHDLILKKYFSFFIQKIRLNDKTAIYHDYLLYHTEYCFEISEQQFYEYRRKKGVH